MKTPIIWLLLCAVVIGACFLLLVILLSGGTFLELVDRGWVRGSEEFTLRDVPSMFSYATVSLFEMTSPCGLPILFFMIGFANWLAARLLTTGLDKAVARNWLMISVWLSSIIATVPIMFAAAYHFLSTIAYNDVFSGGRGVRFALRDSFLLFVGTIFFIILSGLVARLFIKNRKIMNQLANPLNTEQ